MKTSDNNIGDFLVFFSLGLILLSVFTGTSIFRQEFTDNYTSVFEIKSGAWIFTTLITGFAPILYGFAYFSATINVESENRRRDLRRTSQFFMAAALATAVLTLIYMRNPIPFDSGENARWVKEAILFLHVFGLAFGFQIVKIRRPRWLENYSGWALIFTIGAISRVDFRVELANYHYVLNAFIGYVLATKKEQITSDDPKKSPAS